MRIARTLAVVAVGALALSGCTDGDDEATPTPTDTTDTVETTEPTPDADVTLGMDDTVLAPFLLVEGQCAIVEDLNDGPWLASEVACEDAHDAEVYWSTPMPQGETAESMTERCEAMLGNEFTDPGLSGTVYALSSPTGALDDNEAAEAGDDTYCVYVFDETVTGDQITDA